MAQLLKVAAIAFWLARIANLAAVVDQLMRERDPSILRKNPHQLLLNLLRRVPFGEAQPPRNSEDVRVHHYTFGLAEASAEDNIGRLARRAGDRDQLRQRLRNLAAKLSDDLRRRALD